TWMRTSRPLSGLARRSTSPAAASRSTIRSAVDGLTPSSPASVTSLAGPCEASTTSSRNCAGVTASSTAARDRAEIATSRRDAVSIAEVTSSTPSPDPASSLMTSIYNAPDSPRAPAPPRDRAVKSGRPRSAGRRGGDVGAGASGVAALEQVGGHGEERERPEGEHAVPLPGRQQVVLALLRLGDQVA